MGEPRFHDRGAPVERAADVIDLRSVDRAFDVAASGLELALAVTGAVRGGVVLTDDSTRHVKRLAVDDVERVLRRTHADTTVRQHRLGALPALSAPIVAARELLGVVVVAGERAGDPPFDTQAERRLALVARQTASALLGVASQTAPDTAQPPPATEHATSVDVLTGVLHSVAVAANEATSVQEALQRGLGDLCGHLGCVAAHATARDPLIGLRDRLDVWHAPKPGVLASAQAVSSQIHDEIVSEVLATGEPAWRSLDGPDANQTAGLPASAVIRTVLAFPILVGSEVVGVLEFFAPTDITPGRALRKVMASVGGQLGQVVERARAREREARAARDLEVANRDLVAANALKSQFLAMVSHELRTPLTPVIGFADILTERWDSLDESRRKEAVEVIAAEAHHLALLVDELVTMSQINGQVLSVRRQRVELGDIATRARARVGRSAARVAVRGDRSACAWADADHTLRIVEHYLRNALAHGSPPVSIVLHATGSEVMVEVRDAGPGIPAHVRGELFDPFRRGLDGADPHAIRSNSSGIGLGLSVVRGLAEAQGGRAWFEPADPQGSSFWLALPAAPPG